MSSGDELTRRLDSIDQRVHDIAEQVGVLQLNIATLLGAIKPAPLLELLEVRSGQRVLVVGHNAARAARDLREAADDIEVYVIAKAAPLALLLEHAPYDSMLITEPVRSVAWDWIRNTRPGGLIACVYDPTGITGQPVLLRQRGTEATGAFLANGADPLAPRKPDLAKLGVKSFEASQAARRRRTTLPLCPWDVPLSWYLAAFTMPDGLTLARTPDGGVLLETADGSRCHVARRGSHRQVVEDGPENLFDHLVHVHRQWQDEGHPAWTRIQLTVTSNAHILAGIGADVLSSRLRGDES